MTINNITFLSQFFPDGIFTISNPYIDRFYFNDRIEIAQFLHEKLDKNKIYVLHLEFVYSWLTYDEDSPVIVLSKPILITRESNPKILADFILSRINLCVESYFLDDEIIRNIRDFDEGPGVLLKYKEINLF